MRIISWNVNGLRARLKAGFEDSIRKMNPDILCIQETRAKPTQLPVDLIPGYLAQYSIHDKAGYAGATIFSRIAPPLKFSDDFDNGHEKGRVGIAEYKDFILINAYVPNAGQNLEKIEHRLGWHGNLFEFIAAQSKPIIYCGDLNCAPQPMDSGCKYVKCGVSPQERGAFAQVLKYGMTDVFRKLHPTDVEYTWFNNRIKPRNLTQGMRIDSFIVTDELLPRVNSIKHIYDDDLICGSDHVPVLLDINI